MEHPRMKIKYEQQRIGLVPRIFINYAAFWGYAHTTDALWLTRVAAIVSMGWITRKAVPDTKIPIVCCTSWGVSSRRGKFILESYANGYGIGGVLSQVVDGKEKVVEYYSRTLSKPERNYCVTRRELLALLECIKHYHKYLYGQHFLLRTDHSALWWLLQFKNPEGQGFICLPPK